MAIDQLIPKCAWPHCQNDAGYHIFSDTEKQSAYFCLEHKKAVQINFEIYGTMFAPQSTISQSMRPGVNPYSGNEPIRRPTSTTAKLTQNESINDQPAQIPVKRSIPVIIDKKKIGILPTIKKKK